MDNKHATFTLSRWPASAETHLKHWNKFDSFASLSPEVRRRRGKCGSPQQAPVATPIVTPSVTAGGPVTGQTIVPAWAPSTLQRDIACAHRPSC